MEVAPDVLARQQPREGALLGGGDFPLAVADLRRNERQPERCVNLLFRLGRPQRATRGVQPLRCQPPAALRRPRSQPLEMSGGPRQVKEGRARIDGLREAHADLDPVDEQVQPPRALVEPPIDVRKPEDRGDCRRRIAGSRDELDVADRVLATSQRPHRQCPFDPRKRTQVGEEGIHETESAPQRNSRDRVPEIAKRRGDGWFHRVVEAANGPQRSLVDRRRQIGDRGGTELIVQQGELLQRHGARFVQPAQVGRQIGNGRLDEHPGARFEHEPERLQHRGFDVGGMLDEGAEVGVRFDVPRAHHGRGATEQPLVRRIAADPGKRGKLRKRSRKRDDSVSGGSGEVDALAFQRSRFGGRLLGRVLGFGWQVRRQPVGDAAFESHRAVPLTNQHGDDMGARELIRVRVVDHDLAIAWQRQRGSIARVADGARKSDGAVLVGILQPGVDDDRREVAVKLLLQLFSCDARNGHERILSSARADSVNWEPVRVLPSRAPIGACSGYSDTLLAGAPDKRQHARDVRRSAEGGGVHFDDRCGRWSP